MGAHRCKGDTWKDLTINGKTTVSRARTHKYKNK